MDRGWDRGWGGLNRNSPEAGRGGDGTDNGRVPVLRRVCVESGVESNRNLLVTANERGPSRDGSPLLPRPRPKGG